MRNSNKVRAKEIKIEFDEMTTPILQNISGPNLANVVKFFLIFSWFEYALKRAGYLKNQKDAEPDWDSFSGKINGSLSSLKNEYDEFRNAVDYLNDRPPGKQSVKKEANGTMYLVSRVSKPQGNEARVLTTYIRRIRNNLFHGGKVPFDPKRDPKLIKSATTILKHILEIDAAYEVRRCYESGGYFWSPNLKRY
jgi:hypothetical protein